MGRIVAGQDHTFEWADVGKLFALYLFLNLARFMMFGFLWPILKRTG